MISFIIVLVVFPVLIISFNSYSYCTHEEIVIKSAFSVSERVYPYSDIDYIEQIVYSENFSYIAHTRNGKKLDIYIGNGNPELAEAFQAHNLEVIENVVISPIDRLLGFFTNDS